MDTVVHELLAAADSEDADADAAAHGPAAAEIACGHPIAVTDPRVNLTLDELSRCQNLAGRHITFSVTLACPLRCAHCIVDAGPDKGHTTMPLVVARRYASQMSELVDYGIEGICFTGGEPTVARQQVRLMGGAAKAAGMAVSIVTAAQWAATPQSAAAVVAAFDAIDNWDISFDIYHLEWVGLDHVRNACAAVLGAGRNFMLRFTYSDPPRPEELALLAQVQAIQGVRIASQRVRAVGRGEEVAAVDSTKYNPWVKPCLTQGMVVRYDGSVAPCCLNMVESREHPFQLGDSRLRRLVDIHRDYMRDPLLQLIRALGFGQLQTWVQEEGLRGVLPDQLPDEACEMCTAMLHQPAIREMALRKAWAPQNRLRIGLIAAQTLGETALLRDVLGDPAVALDDAERAHVGGLLAVLESPAKTDGRTPS